MDTSQRSLLIVCAISAYYLQSYVELTAATTTTTTTTAEAISNCLDGYREQISEDGTTTACVPCSSCPVGFGVKSICTKSSDTVCEACLDGVSYSDSESALEKCQSCRSCPYQQTSSCTTAQDTQCSSNGNVCDTGFYYDELMLVCNPCGFCDPKLAPPVISQCAESGMSADWSCATTITTTTTTTIATTTRSTTTMSRLTRRSSAPTRSSTEGKDLVSTPNPHIWPKWESEKERTELPRANKPVLINPDQIEDEPRQQQQPQISGGNIDFVMVALLSSLGVLVLITAIYLLALFINKKRSSRKPFVLHRTEIYDNFSDTTHLV